MPNASRDRFEALNFCRSKLIACSILNLSSSWSCLRWEMNSFMTCYLTLNSLVISDWWTVSWLICFVAWSSLAFSSLSVLAGVWSGVYTVWLGFGGWCCSDFWATISLSFASERRFEISLTFNYKHWLSWLNACFSLLNVSTASFRDSLDFYPLTSTWDNGNTSCFTLKKSWSLKSQSVESCVKFWSVSRQFDMERRCLTCYSTLPLWISLSEIASLQPSLLARLQYYWADRL
jgi:hypothetical protein